ncbi:MAG: hypothetical protein JNL88_01575, partial [Bacteroidia bacterium]|nr:hypothetical protein [Bacteroidia bacterium]
MKQKNLLITFDYELFLGRRSGRPEDCMLHPTDLLRSILSHFKVKAVFFADTTYLCKLAELAPHHKQCAEDLDHISAQILQLVDDGHYVLPHIHPHWLDAVYSSTLREFDLSNITRYRFHQLSLAERDAVFSSSVEILQNIIHPKHPDYRINGFRAGGWSLQPFADFKPCFEKHGIVYDMSVVKGLYQFSNAQVYDYSDTPDKPVYRFAQDVSVENGEGPFVEICGTLIRVSQMVDYIDRAHKKVLNVVGFDRDYGKGIGQQSMEIK